jgi:hypothetical protein
VNVNPFTGVVDDNGQVVSGDLSLNHLAVVASQALNSIRDSFPNARHPRNPW